MKFHNPRPIERAKAEFAFASGKSEAICDALVRAAFHDPDWRWVQTQCLTFMKSPNAVVRGLAATCIGHLARLHKQLDLAQVRPALIALAEDTEAGGRAADALDDIRTYIKRPGSCE